MKAARERFKACTSGSKSASASLYVGVLVFGERGVGRFAQGCYRNYGHLSVVFLGLVYNKGLVFRIFGFLGLQLLRLMI